jgi:hypothetical protein
VTEKNTRGLTPEVEKKLNVELMQLWGIR